MYRRAFSTLGCGELTLGEACALAHGHGLDAVELRVLGGALDLPGWLAGRFGQPAHLAQAARQLPVPVVALGTSFKLVGATEAERTDLLAFIPWAEALGVKHLRVFDGGRPQEVESGLAEAVATLGWWRTWRTRQGWAVDLMVETHDSLLTGAQIRRLADAAGGVPVLWDAHHTWKKGGEDPVQTWTAIRELVVHVHVKDSLAGAYVLPGAGEFPMAPLRSVLARDYRGVLSLEWERWWHPGLPPLEQALGAARTSDWW